jgi:hypothetical protein
MAIGKTYIYLAHFEVKKGKLLTSSIGILLTMNTWNFKHPIKKLTKMQSNESRVLKKWNSKHFNNGKKDIKTLKVFHETYGKSFW